VKAHLATLLGGWAFTAGVFYMALFIGFDPEIAQHFTRNPTLDALIAGMLVLAALGVLTAWLAGRQTGE
jgi:Na+-driven multidrug efflux pump